MNKPLPPPRTRTSAKKPIASAARGLMHVFVDELTLPASVGIHPHEKIKKQPVVVSVDLGVEHNALKTPDSLEEVVCYENIANLVTNLVRDRHINLVEQLAEEIAQCCLDLPRVQLVRVQVSKPEAIENARAAGVTIERLKSY